MLEIINMVLDTLVIFLLLIDLILVQKRNRELINIIERNGIVLPSVQVEDGKMATATIEIDVSERK